MHSPRAFPLGVTVPVGTPHVKVRRRCPPRPRPPRLRPCLRKGGVIVSFCRRVGRVSHPVTTPDCQREVRRWQAVRRQACASRGRRGSIARCPGRERSPSVEPRLCPRLLTASKLPPARGHADKIFPVARQLVRRFRDQAALRIGSGNARSGSARSRRQPSSSPLRRAASSAAKASTPCGDQLIPWCLQRADTAQSLYFSTRVLAIHNPARCRCW